MKIMFDARAYAGSASGVGKSVYNLLHALAMYDKQNEYVVITNNPSLFKFNIPHSISFLQSPYRIDQHPLRELWERYVLLKKITDLKINLYFSPSFSFPFGLNNLSKLKKVVAIDDLTAFDYPETMKLLFRYYMRWVIKNSVSMADMVTVISDFMYHEVISRFGFLKSRVVSIPLGPGAFLDFDKAPVDIEHAKKTYALPDNYVLAVGNVEPRKNIKRLINAMVINWEKGMLSHVVLVGKMYANEKSFINIIPQKYRKNIHFTGYVSEEDLPSLYAGAVTFVFPSLYEGFGLPILEAMVCRVPVITSNKGSMLEISGNAALHVDPLNSNEIAGAIEKVVNEKEIKDELIQKGMQRVQKYSWNEAAQKHIQLFNAVA
ncbi:MAG: glycosyltransferase family 1 protein [bacterium]